MLKNEKRQVAEYETLNLATEKFGNLSINKQNIITFEDGLLGFDELKQFVLVNIEECRPFEWLISVEDPLITFPVLNPASLFTDYNPTESIGELASLDTGDTKNMETLCIVTLGNEPTDTTINLKGPILIDMKKKTGKQYVLTADYYSLNYPLVRN